MSKQISAVEWLLKQYLELGTLSKSIVEQAKAMEKEQIKDAYDDGWLYNNQDKYNPEQYYNETFKSEIKCCV